MYEYEFIKTGPGSKTNQHTDFILCRIENKSADHQSDNKNLNDSSISDELADSGANHMILEEEQQSGYQELGHVLLGSGNHDDAELGGSAASVQSVDDVIQEPGDYVNHQPEPPQLLQLPQMGNGLDVYTHEYSNWPSPFRDNDSYLTNKNNTSTNYDNEPVNYSSYNFPSQATDEWHQPVKMNLVFKDDQPAATDMISDPVEHLPNEEPGECTESPNGFWLNHNVINDISTCDDDESFSDFDSPAANKRFQEYCAELGKTLHQPTHQPPLHQLSREHQPQLTHQPPLSYQPSLPHQLPQSQGDCSSTLQLPLYKKPGIGVNNSYPAHKNKISTNDDNEPVSDIANGVQDRATERISEVYNHSTDYRNEPVSNTAYNQHNGAIDECVSEPEDILGSLFQPFDLQDYTLMSSMIEELGDVVHCQ